MIRGYNPLLQVHLLVQERFASAIPVLSDSRIKSAPAGASFLV
jgi:hypothetical protein